MLSLATSYFNCFCLIFTKATHILQTQRLDLRRWLKLNIVKRTAHKHFYMNVYLAHERRKSNHVLNQLNTLFRSLLHFFRIKFFRRGDKFGRFLLHRAL